MVCLEIIRILHINTNASNCKPEFVLELFYFDLFGVCVDKWKGPWDAVGGEVGRFHLIHMCSSLEFGASWSVVIFRRYLRFAETALSQLYRRGAHCVGAIPDRGLDLFNWE